VTNSRIIDIEIKSMATDKYLDLTPAYVKSELIRIASCLLELVPSDLVDDYPQKSYSAGKVAKMMVKPAHYAKMLAYQLRKLSDAIKESDSL
jgi:hypothetical protein